MFEPLKVKSLKWVKISFNFNVFLDSDHSFHRTWIYLAEKRSFTKWFWISSFSHAIPAKKAWVVRYDIYTRTVHIKDIQLTCRKNWHWTYLGEKEQVYCYLTVIRLGVNGWHAGIKLTKDALSNTTVITIWTYERKNTSPRSRRHSNKHWTLLDSYRMILRIKSFKKFQYRKRCILSFVIRQTITQARKQT